MSNILAYSHCHICECVRAKKEKYEEQEQCNYRLRQPEGWRRQVNTMSSFGELSRLLEEERLRHRHGPAAVGELATSDRRAAVRHGAAVCHPVVPHHGHCDDAAADGERTGVRRLCALRRAGQHQGRRACRHAGLCRRHRLSV